LSPRRETGRGLFDSEFWNRTAVRISRAFISPMTAHRRTKRPQPRRRPSLLPQILIHIERGQHDRVSDLARIGRPGRDRGVGGIVVSAEIIRFIRGPKPDRELSDFPTIAFRSAARPDDLAMDHVDTAPCEYLWPDATDSMSAES